MIAERNHDRHTLNQLAQHHLRTAGIIHSPVEIGENQFHIGDRVVAQKPDRDLRPGDASRRDHVLNGSTGTITHITAPQPGPDHNGPGHNIDPNQADITLFEDARAAGGFITVEFDDLPGPVDVPFEWIETPIGPGRGGGLAPAYAVTSYKAEGRTYSAALGLAAPGATHREGLYVTMTRGRTDLQIYTTDYDNSPIRPEPEIPTLGDERTALKALTDTLTQRRPPDVAVIADPDLIPKLER
ncbi:MAG: hypothetical protein ACK5RL_11175 [Acidimicrobiales bacterium]